MTAVMEPETESTAAALDRIGEMFKVPAYVGAPVMVAGRTGRITGADGDHVMVLFHGEAGAERRHPRWGIIWTEQDGPVGVVPLPKIGAGPAWPSWEIGQPQWSGV